MGTDHDVIRPDWDYHQTFAQPLPVVKPSSRKSILHLMCWSFRSTRDVESASPSGDLTPDLPPALQVGLAISTPPDMAEKESSIGMHFSLASTPTAIQQPGSPFGATIDRNSDCSSASSSTTSILRASLPPLAEGPINNEKRGEHDPPEAPNRQSTHSFWSLWFRSSKVPQENKDRRISQRSSAASIGGASLASSGVFSPSLLPWPMPPTTPTSGTGSMVGMEDGPAPRLTGDRARTPRNLTGSSLAIFPKCSSTNLRAGE
ncbi:hypothetical protein F5883DRAFT_182525 [Diaporthe sp. PMI_573]|nr:hypothetical protein F5883DRAFT_182525 [Diaporthaceae sp. PMI_573]